MKNSKNSTSNNVIYTNKFKHNNIEQETSFTTNPFLEDLKEKMLKFSQLENKKKFSVDDLLKW